MGLDMYIEKHTYVKNWNHMAPRDRHIITIKRGGKNVDTIDVEKIKTIVEECGYWRKANAIHAWFVKNVQAGEDDCKSYYVSPDDLRSLLELVKAVLKDHSKAKELLPTEEGFFFGSYEYDKYYFSDLKDTKKIIEAVLFAEGSLYYRSSW